VCCCDVAGNKRKLSPDSGSESSSGPNAGTPQKKPRLFFTEDQKLALRQAYAADPYPNQAAIERLAADVGVGVKTVVNWFHNHRMRAKQQTAHGSASDPCPSSSISSSPGATSLQSAQIKIEDDACSMSPSKNLPSSSPTCSNDATSLANDRVGDQVTGCVVPGSIGGTTVAVRSTAVNKRKRARPHKLSSETTMRDKSDGQTDSLASNDSLPGNSGTEVPIDLSVLRSTTSHPVTDAMSDDKDDCDVTVCRPVSVLSTSVCANAVEWNENEREKNIERLQKNLNQEPADDWAF
jgi:Homeodomain